MIKYGHGHLAQLSAEATWGAENSLRNMGNGSALQAQGLSYSESFALVSALRWVDAWHWLNCQSLAVAQSSEPCLGLFFYTSIGVKE